MDDSPELKAAMAELEAECDQNGRVFSVTIARVCDCGAEIYIFQTKNALYKIYRALLSRTPDGLRVNVLCIEDAPLHCVFCGIDIEAPIPELMDLDRHPAYESLKKMVEDPEGRPADPDFTEPDPDDDIPF